MRQTDSEDQRGDRVKRSESWDAGICETATGGDAF